MVFLEKRNFRTARFCTSMLLVPSKEAELAQNSVFHFSLFVSSLQSSVPRMLYGTAFCQLVRKSFIIKLVCWGLSFISVGQGLVHCVKLSMLHVIFQALSGTKSSGDVQSMTAWFPWRLC